MTAARSVLLSGLCVALLSGCAAGGHSASGLARCTSFQECDRLYGAQWSQRSFYDVDLFRER